MHLRIRIITLLYLVLLLCRSNARPWEIQEQTEFQEQYGRYGGTIVPYIMREVDSWVATLFSEPKVPLIGAGAALAYLGYAGTVMLTSENPLHSARARSDTNSSDLLNGTVSNLVYEALENSHSVVAFRRAGGRALQHGSFFLRRALNFLTKAYAFVYSTLSRSQRALSTNCIAEKLCRVGQLSGTRWPFLGVLLRGLE